MLFRSFHGPRTPSQAQFSGEFCLTADVPRTLEAIAQAVYDLRSLIAWLRSKGIPKIALWGGSFGGYLSGLTATVEPSLDALILLTTPVSTLDLLKRLAISKACRQAWKEMGIEWDFLERLDAPLHLSARKPLLPPERILLIADRKSTRLNSSHIPLSRMPSSA